LGGKIGDISSKKERKLNKENARNKPENYKFCMTLYDIILLEKSLAFQLTHSCKTSFNET
jgi:hypothetical protein